MSTVFSGLSALVIEGVADECGVIWVRASTRGGAVCCPGCGAPTERVHGYFRRRVADVPVDGRRVLAEGRARRLRCAVLGCPRQTFREQLPGVLERYQRRTPRLAAQVGVVVHELAGRAGARVLAALGMRVSRHTALRALLRLPLPTVPTPRVLGVDDFALRRSRRYATVLSDAETCPRGGVFPERTADPLEAWRREHPGVEVACRDGSTTYAEAVRRVLPEAVQVADRWHLWHGLAGAVLKEVTAHSACGGKAGPPLQDGVRA